MATDYLLVLSSRSIFREVELTERTALVRVGTTSRCDERFRGELFFSSFELEFRRDGDTWTVACSDDVYLDVDHVRRLVVKQLVHGDAIDVRYTETGAPLFTIGFSINFERESGAFDRVIDMTGVSELTLGGREGCDVRLLGPYTEGDLLRIRRTGQGLELFDEGTRYGALHDGKRIEGSVPLRDKDFFSVANFYFYYDANQLRCSREAKITFAEGVRVGDEDPQCETSQYPLFTRNTRIQTVMDEHKIPILDPPNPPNPPQGNILTAVLPIVLMLVLSVGLRLFLFNSSNNTYIIISAVMMSIGLLTSVLSIMSERKKYRQAREQRITRYNAYIEQKRADVSKLRAEELSILRRRYLSTGNELKRVREFSGDLFDRSADDVDFLDVRLGTGLRASVKQVDFKEREKLEADELAELPRKVYEEFIYVKDAPITVEFAEQSAVGVVADPRHSYEVLKNMVVDLVTRQFATDVKLFFVVSQEREHLIHWARLLPHVQNEELGRRNVACDEESRNVLFEYLFKALSEREGAKRDAKLLPRFVIFVVDELGLKNHPLSRFIPMASSLGATFVFFEEHKEYLPMGCGKVITLGDDGESGTLVSAENSLDKSSFSYTTIDDYSAWQVAQTLAPVYSEEVSLEGTLTQSYGLFEMLGVIAAEDIDLAGRWAASQVFRSMAAPIGMSKAGMVTLDLSDKADGPHGLVAGTTGAGKSELLLTYLISLATLFPPDEVAFMIIDFKGGGMADQLNDLPHLIGTITNIDGREIDRSLKSIRAELQKRQHFFREAGVNHIDAYIKMYKARQVSEPLPHLIIVVDEFAELKADQPEFMAELVSAARIGRSLGVHLILATQKPAGQVSEQIWSNSRFKLCLKVASREDSNEMLKSPLAAEIKEPGRAYLQVGMNERFELFQSAYSGGPEHQDAEDVHEFAIFEVENSGKRVPVYARSRQRSDALRTTQLDAVVDHVHDFCEHMGIPRLPSICLPPLPDSISFPATSVRMGEGYALGLYDDPDHQYQGDAVFDIDTANTFVLGSSQTGKTNLIEVMIRAIAEHTTPSQSAIYVMDFASMILKNLEDLNHVGGVVLSSEDEKLKNLFKLLNEELVQRKNSLLAAGVSSFAAYVEAGRTDLPHIYVFLDNFAVFRELFGERYEDDLIALCRDGLTYGISVVVTNSGTAGFGYKYMSNFSNRIAFTCNDTGEYSSLFDRCRMEPKNVAGRALCTFDKALFEMQTYLGFEGEREVDRSEAMHAFVSACNNRHPGERARRIPSVPDDLTLGFILENYQVPESKIAYGLSYETVSPVWFDLETQFQVALVGEGKGSRGLFIKTLFDEVDERSFDRSVEMYLVDNIQRGLSEYQDRPYVMAYHGDYNEVDTVVDEVAERVNERVELVRAAGPEALAHEPYLIVIVNSVDAIKRISDVKDTQAAYDAMAAKAKGMRVIFIFSDVPNESAPYSAPALLKSLREARVGLLFDNAGEQKLIDLTGPQARMYRAPLERGQAFVVAGSDVAKVRFAIGV